VKKVSGQPKEKVDHSTGDRRWDGSSVARSLGQVKQVDQRTGGRRQTARLGLKDIEHDQLKEALDTLLTLVHCLVVRGGWWQEALSQHPLLLLQVLMTVADVSFGKDGWWHGIISIPLNLEMTLHTSPSFHLVGLGLLPLGLEITLPWKLAACRHCLTSQSPCWAHPHFS
jgi:hypothetical protein